MRTISLPQLCGRDNVPFSSKVDSSVLMNLYRETNQGDSENDYCLIKVPGLKGEYQPSGGPGRFRGSLELNDHVFVVVGNWIYDFDSSYALFASYGPIENDGLPVFMAIDNLSCLIVSASKLYAINSGVLTTPATPVTPITVVLIRGYWVIVGPPSPDQLFFFSTDGLTWNALDFQSTEGAPNNIVAAIVDHQQLWMIGNRISQVFEVGTDPDTPFIPRQDAVIMEGTEAASSLCASAGVLFWLGRNKNGGRNVVRASGYQPEKVSTYAVSNTLRQLARVDDCIAMAFQVNGHEMVWFTFPSADRTLCFDATENDWYEVGEWDSTTTPGSYHRHRGNTMVAAFGKILIGDHTNGWLMSLSADYYSNDEGGLMGTESKIRWVRRCPHITKNNRNVQISRFEVTAEVGVGL